MSASTLTDLTVVRAHASGPADRAVADLTDRLLQGLGPRSAGVVVYFASASYDPAELAGPISGRFPGASVIGCSSAGEFTDGEGGTGGLSAVAFPEGIVLRAAAALGDLTTDPAAGTDAAVAEIEASLRTPLRTLDPARHLGLVLIDGLHNAEETVNERLGNAAPLLDVVGGSAGDDLAFTGTWVAVGDRVSYRGVALLVMESGVPFRIVKTCSAEPTGRVLRITRADVPNRIVHEFDGRPAADVYAEALGMEVDRLRSGGTLSYPLGLMIDGKPWIRSPQQILDDGSIRFYAQILEGMEVEVMRTGDLPGETAAAIREVTGDLGGTVRGGVMFNCILRRLELDQQERGADFLAAFRGVPVAGFHTYGESWLGHVNQTLTGVVFG